jgi:glycosyltransferase involved in cell wall biosynthesis
MLVSVCIPAYNDGRFLRATMEAGVHQDVSETDVVVVDNGSTDETEPLGRALQGKYDVVRYARNERNPMLFGNFSRRLELASRMDVKLLAADDRLAPGAQAEGIVLPGANPDAGTVPARGRFEDEHGVPLHFPDPMAHVSSLMLPRSVPVVITWHSDIVRQARLLKLYRPLQYAILRCAAAIIAPTPSHFAALLELARFPLSDRFRTVPFGVDVLTFAREHPMASEIRACYPEALVFVPRRLVYYKGFDYPIDVTEATPGAWLLLGGTGRLSEGLRQRAAASRAAERITCLGRVQDTDVPAYYQACNGLCMPSMERSEACEFFRTGAQGCMGAREDQTCPILAPARQCPRRRSAELPKQGRYGRNCGGRSARCGLEPSASRENDAQ